MLWGLSNSEESLPLGTKTKNALDLVLILLVVPISRKWRERGKEIQRHRQHDDIQEEKERGTGIIKSGESTPKVSGFES